MDSPIRVTIEGADDLMSAFKRAPSLFVKIFDPAIKTATLLVLGISRTQTPIDTGFLRGPGMETSFEALLGRIDNVAPYAVYVHEGTKFMEARPFFMWGLEQGQSQVNDIFEKAVDEFTNQI